eukprot:3379093-Pyramimonas_sp.AAC.1
MVTGGVFMVTGGGFTVTGGGFTVTGDGFMVTGDGFMVTGGGFMAQAAGRWAADGPDESLESAASMGAEAVAEKAELLSEYFTMEIDTEGRLRSLPLLVRSHAPPARDAKSYC